MPSKERSDLPAYREHGKTITIESEVSARLDLTVVRPRDLKTEASDHFGSASHLGSPG